jgi:adenylate kinase
LAQAGGHYHLSSGDIFRGLDPESELGRSYFSYAQRGLLVPDELTISIFTNFVHGLITTNRFFPSKQLLILDGIPRTKPQASMLNELLRVEKVVILDIENEQKLFERVRKRALIEKRFDDTDPKVLSTRLRVYREETALILDGSYDRNLLVSFQADQKPFQVLNDALTALGSIL